MCLGDTKRKPLSLVGLREEGKREKHARRGSSPEAEKKSVLLGQLVPINLGQKMASVVLAWGSCDVPPFSSVATEVLYKRGKKNQGML